ncbi:helix-turn-helix transcriptional regulator [Streptomyces sp. UNOC14_S4]|uniref:helix-turn-helix transcriptional regulator n=1 Tax=Streptomyces sp. UNOC14_S4 TaxID=2872340 RepID=UPI001E2D111F|nr:helix-turn-helix transcriptional regulator [Streptomyces sp. UNOC14_S4]MCC3767682.1 transcriptional regulator [Streptomyces sp. UNOC14_S4]
MKSVQDFSPAAFRAAYEERGLTQADVAKAIGVTVNTVGRWVRGKGAPSTRLFAMLVAELRVPRSRMLLPLAPDADLVVLRTRAGLRQEDVAEHLGVQASDVSEMEMGTGRVRDNWPAVLADLYGVPLDLLVKAAEVTEKRWRAGFDAKRRQTP